MAKSTAKLDYASIGRAMLHPTQLRILESMSTLRKDEGYSPNQLSLALEEPLGNVSYHISVLAGKKGKFAGNPLIRLIGTKPRRGAVEHYYSLC